MEWLRSPQILHWVSGNAGGFEANRRVVEEIGPAVSKDLGMDKLETLGVVEAQWACFAARAVKLIVIYVHAHSIQRTL